MFEWIAVKEVNFINANGKTTSVKLTHEIPIQTGYEVDCNGKDLDLIAYEELGNEFESLRLMENNSTVLAEYDFNMSKIRKIKIPV